MAQLINNQIGFSQEQQSYPYVEADMRVWYAWDSGTLQLPVAYVTNQQAVVNPQKQPSSGRQAAVIVQTAAPRGLKVVRFRFRRLQALPLAPDPFALDPNSIFAGGVVNPLPPEIQPDGQTYIYGIEGQYAYHLYRPLFTTDQLREGALPTDNTTAAGNVTTPSQFSAGLI